MRSPITPPRTRAELNRLREYFGWFGPKDPWTGDLAIILRFYRSDRRALDYDNLAKMIGDAGNGILWKDDAQIVRADISKILGVGAAAACTKIRILRPTAEARGQLL
jgi:Holliday junction resolvase RusA-like endonuclease